MSDTRAKRETESRDQTLREQSWGKRELLPLPPAEDGYEFRYIRSSVLGLSDNVNVSAKFREGWEPVKRSEVKDMKFISDHDSRFPEYIEVGGLILCKCPTEIAQRRRDMMAKATSGQMEAVDRSYLKTGDPRMPLLATERKTRVSRFSDD